MLTSLQRTFRSYPRQFWVLFFGQLVSASGGSLVWPFLTIYLRQKLGIPLATVGLLFLLNALVGLFSTFVAGPAVDRLGRKPGIVLSLALGAIIWISFGLANSYPAFVFLMAFSALFDPFYRTSSSAMVADIVEPRRRPEAYALLRMVANIGVAIGPAVGGFLATRSYLLSFMVAASCDTFFFLLALLMIHETKPEVPIAGHEDKGTGIGYRKVLGDYPFLGFCGASILLTIAYAQMMTLLSIYIKENFGIPESGYGFIMTANAAMVVFLQFSITRLTERHRRLPVLAVGALFIAAGVGSVALGRSFPAFLMSMALLTIGEMIVIPTATALVADLAPITMRGRYMGFYGLTWSSGFGLGPVVGGTVSDVIGPRYIWYEALGVGLLSAAAFMALTVVLKPQAQAAISYGSEGEHKA